MPPPPRKYRRLADYLAAQHSNQLTLTFAEIEHIMRGALPATAYTRTFWSNNQRSRGRPAPEVSSVGWQVVTADLWQRRVTFRRVPSDLPSPPPAVDCKD